MKRYHFSMMPLMLIMFFLMCLSGMATAPVANPDVFQAIEGVPLLLDVTANDYDVDGDPLIVELVDADVPTCWGKTLNQLIINNGDGSLIFKTPIDVSTSCEFTYQLKNGGSPSQAAVTIHITKASTLLPVITDQPDMAIVNYGENASFSVTAVSDYAMTYQWEKDGQALTDGTTADGVIVQGVTEPTLTVNNIALTSLSQYRCVVSNDFGDNPSDLAGLLLLTHDVGQGSFFTVPSMAPGIIQAEHFDLGGEGVAYHDVTAGNSGAVFRTGDVDFAAGSDGTFYVTGIDDGEWLEFTVNIPIDGNYDLSAMVAGDTSDDVRFHWETANGIQLSCDQRATAASGSEDWLEVTASNVPLLAGPQTIRWVADSVGWNFDAITIYLTSTALVQGPYFGTPPNILSGPLEIEFYDKGGQNLAYMDLSDGNSSDACLRAPDWVDLDLRESENIVAVDIESGEWLEYTVFIKDTLRHDITLRYQADAPTTVELRIPGSPDTVVNMTLPARPEFGPATFTEKLLPAGTHVMRLTFTDATGKNLQVNKMEFAESAVYPIRITDAENGPITNGQAITLNPIPIGTSLDLVYELHNDHPSLALQVDPVTFSGPGWQLIQGLPGSIAAANSATFTVRLFSATALDPAIGSVTLQTSGSSTETVSFELQGSVFVPLTEIDLEWAEPVVVGNLNFQPVTGTQPLHIPIDPIVDRLFFLIRNQGVNTLTGQLSVTNSAEFDLSKTSVTVSAPPQNVDGFEVFVKPSALSQPGPKQTTVRLEGNFPGSPFTFEVVKVVIDGTLVEIIEEPTNIQIPLGGSGQLQLIASGGSDQGLDYQWSTFGGLNDDPIDPQYLNDRYSGSDTATLIITDATLNEAKTYNCWVRDARYPDNAVQSRHVSVAVYEPIFIDASGPVDKHAEPGEEVQFSILAGGAFGELSYRWQYKDLSSNWVDLNNGGRFSGTDQPILKITQAQDSDVGQYRCRVFQATITENEAFSQEAGLSLLRFTSLPADGWGFPGETYTLSSGATAGGRTLSYKWFLEDQVVDGATGSTFTGHFRSIFQSTSYEVSDGIHTLSSKDGQLHPIRSGILAADSFNRGDLNRRHLNAGVLLPYGGRVWQATGNLVFQGGQAFNDQTLAATDIGTITYEPRTDHRMGLQVEIRFGNNPPVGSWFGFGFSTNGLDLLSDGEIWVQLKPGSNGSIHYEVFANGTNHSIGQGTVTSPNLSWSLEHNPNNHTVTLKNGFAPVVHGASANVAPDFQVNHAQFMFTSPTANGANGGDFLLSKFQLFETAIFFPNPDFAAIDINSQDYINIDVLANDQGDGLSILTLDDLGQNVQTVHEDGRWQVRYNAVNASSPGEVDFLYTLKSVNPGESSTARVTVLRYQDFAFLARPDEITAQADRATEFNPTINDFHSEEGHFEVVSTLPIVPNHGTATVLADGQRIRYTPSAGFLGTDQFTYQIKDEQDRITQAVVKLFVTQPFDGQLHDQFSNVGVGRSVGSMLDNVVGQSADFVWSDLDPSYNAPFQFGTGELTHDFTGTFSDFQGIRFHESLDTLLSSTLLDDGFETGSLSNWSLMDDENHLTISNANPITGGKSLLVNFEGSSTVTRRMIHTLAAGQDRIRLQFKLDTQNLTMATNDRFQAAILGAPGTVVILYIQQKTSVRRMYLVAYDLDTQSHQSQALDLSNGIHDIQIDWAAGAVGSASMRLDGGEPVFVPSFANHRQRITKVTVGAHGADPNSSGFLSFDDIQVRGKKDLATQLTIAFPIDAASNDTATLSWVQFPEALKKFREGLHLQVKADGRYSVIQNVLQENDFAMASGQLPLGAGQPIRMEFWYHGVEKSISVWLNGFQVLDRTLLNQRGSIDKWHTLGFFTDGSSGASEPFRVLDFSMQGDVTPPLGALPETVVYDSFNGIDGTQIRYRPTEVGNLTWLSNERTILSDNQLTLTGTGGKAFAVPFDPDHYEGDQFELTAAIAPGGSDWTSLSFSSGATSGHWNTAEIWVKLHPDGTYLFQANRKIINLSHGNKPIPGFSPHALNHTRLRYNKTTGMVHLWLNGVLVNSANLGDYGYTPNISFAGIHVHNNQEATPTYIEDFRVSSNDGRLKPAGEQVTLLAEAFDVGGTILIHNRNPTIGSRKWQTTSEMFYQTYAAGIGQLVGVPQVDQVGGFPFLPANYEGQDILIEADAKVGNGESVGVGFSSAFADFSTHGQLWVEVLRSGQWRLLTQNASILTSGHISGFDLNQWVRIQLWYDRTTNTADLWINGVTVAQNRSMPAGFTPHIRFAGLDLDMRSGIPATTLFADNFRLSLDDTTPSDVSKLVPEAVDTYTQNGASILNNRSTEQGNLPWSAHPYFRPDDDKLIMYNGAGQGVNAYASVPFNASAYSGNLFSIESEFLVDNATWMGVGFSSGTTAFGFVGEVWAKMDKTGQVWLQAFGSNTIYSGQAKVFFPADYNKLTVVYNRQSNTASLLVNDVVQVKGIALSSVPNILYGQQQWNAANTTGLTNYADNFIIKIDP